MPRVFSSLRYRIFFSIVLIEVVMLSIMVWANTTEVGRTHAARLAQSANVIQQQFTSTVGRYIIEADYPSMEEYATAVMMHDELHYVIVEDLTGRELLSIGTVPAARQLDEMPADSQDGVYDTSSPILFGGRARGVANMGFSLALMQSTTRKALLRGITIAAIEVALSIVAALLIGHALTRNLKVLSQAVERFTRGQSDISVKVRGRDEIAQVAEAFNTMVRDRAAAEGALRQSEEHLRLLLEFAGEGIYGIDLEGNCTFANAECLRLLGFEDLDDLLYCNIHALIHHTRSDGTAYPEADCPVYRAFRERTSVHCDTEVLWRADGSSFPADYRAVPILRDGEVIGAVVTFTDITELRAAEEQLRQAQKMEAVGQLTGGVAHDFNNLLSVILGNIELTREQLSGNDKALQRIDNALHALYRGRDLNHRLLAFSRRQALQPEATDLNALIGGLIQILERTLGETIEIRTELSDDLYPAIIDRGQLETAVLNLAVNARDAMPEGGRLTIETGRASLDRAYAAKSHDGVVAGDYAMVALSDSGGGMTPEVAKHAFEPFFTTKDVGEGSGLGLSMVYGFVKQSGGHVKIYSEPGRGTTVRLYLPPSAAEVVPEERRPDSAAEPRGHGERILVVEDDLPVRELLVTMLGDLGYRVAEAGDGPSALALLEQDDGFDLLVTDLVLPGGMTGAALGSEARKRFPDLAMLHITGYTASAAQGSGLLRERADVLSKPFEKRRLAECVRARLGDPGQGLAAPSPEAAAARRESPPTVGEPCPEAFDADDRGVVLVVDDDPAVLLATVDLIESLGYRALRALDGKEALDLLDRGEGVDVLMTDLGLGRGMSGRDLAREAVERRPGLRVLFASGDTRRSSEDATTVHKPYTLKQLEQRLGTLLAAEAGPPDVDALKVSGGPG